MGCWRTSRWVGLAGLLVVGCFNDSSPSTTNSDSATEGEATGNSASEGASTSTSGTTDETVDVSSGDDGCPPFFADCDGNPANGCETEVSADPNNCGGCGVPCESPMFCGAGECLAGCAENIIHVSPEGDDTFHGCTPEFAMRTVSGAIRRARDAQLTGHEVRACEGAYDEAVVLDYPVSLRGGYSCNTWMRTPEFPDDTQSSLLSAEDEPAILAIAGGAVDRDVLVDGWGVFGADLEGFSAAIVVAESASPTIRDVFAVAGVGAQQGSAGILVESGGAPLVERCGIDGGGREGEDGAVALRSVGVWLADDAGAAAIRGNTINGGAARGGTGSIGLIHTAATDLVGENAIVGNTISGGSGSCPGEGGCNSSVGVLVNSPQSTELVANVISGGQAHCENTNSDALCIETGVVVNGTGTTVVRANRILAGEPQDPYMFVRGLAYVPTPGGLVADNFVHGGRPEFPSERDHIAILVEDSASEAIIVHNTIATSAMTEGSSTSVGLETGSSPTRLGGNFFVGSNRGDVAIRANSCAGQMGDITDISNNAFANHERNLVEVWRGGAACAPSEVGNTIDTALDAIGVFNENAPAMGEGNVRFGDCARNELDCLGSPSCPGNSCAASFFETWGDDGISPLLDNGWRLSATQSCALVEGAPAQGGLDADGYGTPRTNPISIGAEEFDAACQSR